MKNTIILIAALLLAVSCKELKEDKTNIEGDSISNTEKQTDDAVNTPESEPEQTETMATEEFEDLEFMGLNMELEEDIPPMDFKKWIRLFSRGKITDEGNQTMDIEEKKLSNGDVETTMILDNLLDDSVKSEKYIMVFHQENGLWQITSLKKNWRCREGRGHTDWGITPCN